MVVKNLIFLEKCVFLGFCPTHHKISFSNIVELRIFILFFARLNLFVEVAIHYEEVGTICQFRMTSK